jgi:hypothetical protein
MVIEMYILCKNSKSKMGAADGETGFTEMSKMRYFRAGVWGRSVTNKQAEDCYVT